MICPKCGTENNTYQSFSGGREMWCYDHDDTFMIADAEGPPPRATLLQTPEGRIALKAQMDQELARLRDARD